MAKNERDNLVRMSNEIKSIHEDVKLIKTQNKVINTYEQLNRTIRTSIDNKRKKIALMSSANRGDILNYFSTPAKNTGSQNTLKSASRHSSKSKKSSVRRPKLALPPIKIANVYMLKNTRKI